MTAAADVPQLAPGLTRKELTRWRNCVLITFALSGLALASWLSRVPAVRDQLQVSTTTLGLLIFGLAAGSLLGLTASSHIIESIGTARSVAYSLSVGSLGLPLAAGGALLDAPVLVFAGLFVFGAGTGMTDVAMNVAGAANERALGRTVMPLFHAAFSLGTVVGVGIGAAAEAAAVPVVIHVSVVAALVLGGALLVVRGYQPEDSGHDPRAANTPKGGWRSRLAAWREPRTLLIGLVVLGMAFAEGSANDWLPLAMVDGHGLDNAAGAAVLGVFLAAMTLGRIAGGPLLDRYGRVPVLRGSALFAVAGLLMLILIPNPVLAIVGAALWGLGAALGFPVGMSAAADDPSRAAARVSAVATIGYCAFLVGPPLIGFLADQVGLLNALSVVLVLIAVAGVASSAARQPRGAAQNSG